MKKKEIILALCTVIIFGGGVLISKLVNTKSNLNFKETITRITGKSTGGNKNNELAKSKDKNLKTMSLYKLANTCGNSEGNLMNDGLVAQQENWLYFSCNGLNISLKDFNTGWKKICDDSAMNINVIGDWIYYLNGNSYLCKIKADGSGKTILSNNVTASFLLKDNYIYCITGVSRELYRMNIDLKTGTKLAEGLCKNFTMDKEWIYYTYSTSVNDKTNLWKISYNGSRKEKVVDDCSTMIIEGQWIYYTDYLHRLCRVKNDGSSKQILPSNYIESFIIDGEYLYYFEKDISKGESTIYRMKIDNLERTKIETVKDIKLFFINTTSENVILLSRDGKMAYKFKK